MSAIVTALQIPLDADSLSNVKHDAACASERAITSVELKSSCGNSGWYVKRCAHAIQKGLAKLHSTLVCNSCHCFMWSEAVISVRWLMALHTIHDCRACSSQPLLVLFARCLSM